MIEFSMQIVARDEKRKAILRTLGSLLGPTRAAAGCLQAQLYADLDKRRTLMFVRGLVVAITFYNIAVAAVLASAGLDGPYGVLLWPAVAFHAAMGAWCLGNL